MKELKNSIIRKIKKGEEISPFLFIDQNLEVANSQIKNLALDILQALEIPKVFLYVFEDDGETIKVQNLRTFSEQSHIKTPYPIQIFFIENISRFTIGSGNSLLKFLEEPGKQNLIFLSNIGENNILETILSRVQTINLGSQKTKKENLFFQDLIKNYVWNNDTELVSYFFKNKLEKSEYIDFLKNLILFSKKNLIFIDLLEEIVEDIQLIEKNNVNAKYIVDKWILKIG